MQDKRRLGIIFTFPISESRGDFLTHIPVRMRRLLGNRVDIYVIYSGPLNRRILIDQGMHTIEMPRIKNKKIARLTFPFILFFFAARLFRKDKLDVLMNANNHKWMLLVAFAAHLFGKRAVARVTGDILIYQYRGIGGKMQVSFDKLIEKLALRTVDEILCVSHSIKTTIIKRMGQKQNIHVISQGVDTQRFKIPSHGKVLDHFAKRLIFIGRIEPDKGLVYALNAFKQLRNKGYVLSFDIYGDGSQRGLLEEQYSHIPGIRFHGHISHDKVPNAFASGGILVLPSFHEGLSNTVLEAMASGIFVIASDAGDNSLLLGKDERGIVLSSVNTFEIRESIIRILKKREDMIKSLFEAHDYIMKFHSFHRLRQKYLDILFGKKYQQVTKL